MERDLIALLRGEEIEVPEYNFVTGMREYNGKKLQLKEGCVLLLEGIHALNPMLTEMIPESTTTKVRSRRVRPSASGLACVPQKRSGSIPIRKMPT